MRYADNSGSERNWNDLGRRDPEFVEMFRQFSRVLLDCQQKASKSKASEKIPDSTFNEAQGIWTVLLEALEIQKRTMARESGPYGAELFREVGYVEAVLADEVFLSMEWPGRKFWTSHLLEAQLFGTHTAGELFFTRVDFFLTDRNTGPEGLELLYFLALSFGFQGKYRDRQDQAALASYKRQLYRRYYVANPTGLDKLRYAFPACYEHTLESFVPRLRPSPLRWAIALLSTVLIWLFITQVLWSDLTMGLIKQTRAVLPSISPVSGGLADAK